MSESKRFFEAHLQFGSSALERAPMPRYFTSLLLTEAHTIHVWSDRLHACIEQSARQPHGCPLIIALQRPSDAFLSRYA